MALIFSLIFQREYHMYWTGFFQSQPLKPDEKSNVQGKWELRGSYPEPEGPIMAVICWGLKYADTWSRIVNRDVFFPLEGTWYETSCPDIDNSCKTTGLQKPLSLGTTSTSHPFLLRNASSMTLGFSELLLFDSSLSPH